MDITVKFLNRDDEPDVGPNTFFKEGTEGALCTFLEVLTSEHPKATFTVSADQPVDILVWAGMGYRLEFGPKVNRSTVHVRKYI
jgi:hypothetical protein